MPINKFQRSRLTLHLSAKVTHIGFPSIYSIIFFSETTEPNELTFYIETPYDRLAKIYANCFGHMTKMATTSINDKNLLKIFFSRTRRPMTLGLGIQHLGSESYYVCTNDYSVLTLIYFMASSNSIRIAFMWEKS